MSSSDATGLREALDALVKALDAAQPWIDGAQSMAYIHGWRYAGPEGGYGQALDAARRQLSKNMASESAQGMPESSSHRNDAAAPQEPRWPSRKTVEEAIAAWMHTSRACKWADFGHGMAHDEDDPHRPLLADAILAALREGAERP